MKRLPCLFALLYSVSGFAAEFAGCGEHIKYGPPAEVQGDEQGEAPLCRLAYAASHDPVHKVPDWVAYHLTREKVAGVHPRKDNFRADQELFEGQRAELSDYKNSGYDRGHMIPAAAVKWSPQAMDESFLLSNIVPQIGNGFNRHIWARLEKYVREWTTERGELYVVTGVIYDPEPLNSIGENDVSVPSHFYKAVFDPVKIEGIAFLLPHERLSTSDLPSFAVSIDTVEEKTGYDLLPSINDEVEAVIESTKSLTGWMEQ